jgi:1-deoxy-D-xylulose-5-phosphate reductoisomerase
MSTGVSILGSTGSVGETTLRVIRHLKGQFHVVGLAAGRGVQRLVEQVEEFRPRVISVVREEDAADLRRRFPGLEVVHGTYGATLVAEAPEARTVVAAIVGAPGLAPTYRAVQKGKRVALANKESLVMAGRLMMEASRRSGAELLPVDSEHCAVFQCVRGENKKQIRRIVLTASGGSLRDAPLSAMEDAPLDKVLSHPTWKMGRKITVDSATMMNKGLEIIEAFHLFEVPLERIEVLIHPQSIVHSMVEYLDGSVMAQLATADMALPVQYALTYPVRSPGAQDFLDLAALGALTFKEPDLDRYPCLQLARHAARTSEGHTIAMNAANEEAVAAFLAGHIRFGGIHRCIARVMDKVTPSMPSGLEEVLAFDKAGRALAREELRSMGPRT